MPNIVSSIGATVILIGVGLMIVISVIPRMTMPIGTRDDFHPNAGAGEVDSLRLGRERGADSHRADKAEREQSLRDCSHDTVLDSYGPRC
jgi:hypothetical protein